MTRAFAKLLVVLAVLVMPFGMAPAWAAAPAQHHVAMPMQHCPEPAPNRSGKAGFVECTMACSAALPAADDAIEQPLVIICAPTGPAAAQILSGLHPDTATPPPKRS